MDQVTSTNIEGKTFMGEVNLSVDNTEEEKYEEDVDENSDEDFSDVES